MIRVFNNTLPDRLAPVYALDLLPTCLCLCKNTQMKNASFFGNPLIVNSFIFSKKQCIPIVGNHKNTSNDILNNSGYVLAF